MMIKRILLASAFALATLSGALAQGAAKPTLVGTFKDWTTWAYTGAYAGSGQGKVCYIYAEPAKAAPSGLDHGRVSFSLTSSPSQGVQVEANFVAGYQLQEQSSVTVDIDGKKFTMFTQGDSAWMLNKTEEAQLLAAMKSGKAMVVSAVSRRGNKTTYNYSLSGVTAAADKMTDECK
jgi:invasion protein IalB